MACNKNPDNIKKMFDEISEYYDKMNNIISAGTHYLIKYLALRELDIKPRTMILDVCCGTGDFSKIISKFYPRANVIGLDFSKNMLKIAKKRNSKGVFVQSDCTQLPFKEGEFDYITAGFGLRNVEDRTKAISEIYRTLNKGGKFLHLDFGEHNILSKIFDFVVPIIVKIAKKNEQNYKYLLESKNDFPAPDKLIQEFENNGFKYLKKCDYLWGTISIQIMQK